MIEVTSVIGFLHVSDFSKKKNSGSWSENGGKDNGFLTLLPLLNSVPLFSYLC